MHGALVLGAAWGVGRGAWGVGRGVRALMGLILPRLGAGAPATERAEEILKERYA